MRGVLGTMAEFISAIKGTLFLRLRRSRRATRVALVAGMLVPVLIFTGAYWTGRQSDDPGGQAGSDHPDSLHGTGDAEEEPASAGERREDDPGRPDDRDGNDESSAADSARDDRGEPATTTTEGDDGTYPEAQATSSGSELDQRGQEGSQAGADGSSPSGATNPDPDEPPATSPPTTGQPDDPDDPEPPPPPDDQDGLLEDMLRDLLRAVSGG